MRRGKTLWFLLLRLWRLEFECGLHNGGTKGLASPWQPNSNKSVVNMWCNRRVEDLRYYITLKLLYVHITSYQISHHLSSLKLLICYSSTITSNALAANMANTFPALSRNAVAPLLAAPEELASVLLATSAGVLLASMVGMMLVSIEVAALLEFDVADAELVVASLELLIVAFAGAVARCE